MKYLFWIAEFQWGLDTIPEEEEPALKKEYDAL